MTRQERERELLYLMRHDFGRMVEIYKRVAGIPEGTMVQAGTLASQMIEKILDAEFPTPKTK